MDGRRGQARRLFFAAWPSAEIRRRLHALAAAAQRECGGQAVLRQNVHLTLAFLGEVAPEQIPGVEAVGNTLHALACELRLHRLDYQRRNRIVWAAPDACPPPLNALAAGLAAALRAAGLRCEERPYVPHVTLLRNARRPPLTATIEPVVWPVRELSLVESLRRDGASVYEVVRQWPLRP